MSAADEAYKAAEEKIARVKAAGETKLDFDDEKFRALEELPPEIAELTGLQGLSLNQTQVSDLTPIRDLTGLQGLSFNQTQVSDLTPIRDLTGLQGLSLTQTQVSDLTPIRDLTGLQGLSLNQTQVSDLTPIRDLTGLQELSLDQTQVSDLTPIRDLTGLQELSLYQTQVSDLTPIRDLTGLQWLSLDHTQVSDLRPLLSLEGLRQGAKERDPRAALFFDGCPALRNDPVLQEFYGIDDVDDRTLKVLDHLATLPPWPEPLPGIHATEPAQDVANATADLEVPTAPLAPLMVDMSERGALVPLPPPDNLSEAQADLARDGWQALKDYLDQITPLLDKLDNSMPMLGHALRALGRALGSEFDSVNQVAVGMQAHLVCELSKAAGEYLDTQDAIVIKAFAAQSQIYLTHFSTWQSFQAFDAPETEVVEQVKQDQSDFHKLAQGLEDTGLAGADVLYPLRDIIETGVAQEATAMETLGLLTSFQNIQVTIVQNVVQSAHDPEKTPEEQEFWDGVHEASKAKLLDKTIDSLPAAAIGASVSFLLKQSGPLNRLAGRYPSWFGFVRTAQQTLIG